MTGIPPASVFLIDDEAGPIGPGPGRLEAVVVFRESAGQIDVAEVRLISHDPAQAITADLWRRIRIGDVIARARSGLAEVAAALVAQRPRGDRAEQAARRGAEETRGPGRPRELTDGHLREVADVYLRARVLAPRRARQEVAEHFAADGQRVKSWIHAATVRGFIP